MAHRFLPPDIEQARWLVQSRDRAHSYCEFLTLIHELLSLYGEGHGLPHGVPIGLALGDHLEHCEQALQSFEFTIGGREGAAASIADDVARNKRSAIELSQRGRKGGALDLETTIFLRSVVDSYEFVLRSAPRP